MHACMHARMQGSMHTSACTSTQWITQMLYAQAGLLHPTPPDRDSAGACQLHSHAMPWKKSPHRPGPPRTSQALHVHTAPHTCLCVLPYCMSQCTAHHGVLRMHSAAYLGMRLCTQPHEPPDGIPLAACLIKVNHQQRHTAAGRLVRLCGKEGCLQLHGTAVQAEEGACDTHDASIILLHHMHGTAVQAEGGSSTCMCHPMRGSALWPCT